MLCEHSRSFVYVSTTYANATQQFVEKEVLEQFYPAPVPPELMISMAESFQQDRFQAIADK